jgi:hypothetical protein
VNAQTAASNVTVVKSSTWAGFGIEAPNAGVTAIKASFKQPALYCSPTSPTDRYAEFVAGLNGQLTTAFEFVGTEATCPAGSTTAKYLEIATAPMAPIIPIIAGHYYAAAIVESGGTYHYVLKDVTTGAVSKGKGAGPNLVFAAECIVLRGTGAGGGPAPLARFVPALFGMDFTNVQNSCYDTYSGTTKPIAAFGGSVAVNRYVMYNSAMTSVDANTSPISADESSFRVVWVASGP